MSMNQVGEVAREAIEDLRGQVMPSLQSAARSLPVGVGGR
jgi:hypothetical protein